MGVRRVGLKRLEGLIENLKREITLTDTNFVQTPKATAGFANAIITIGSKDFGASETFRLVDGDGTAHVFTVLTGSTSVLNNNVGIKTGFDANNTTTIAASFVSAINDSSATTSGKIVAENNTNVISLRQLVKGTTGNTTITDTVADGTAFSITQQFKNGVGHGAGAISTEIAPKTYIERVGGDFVTTIEVDLTGFSAENDIDDVIGITGTDAAYLTELTTARNGIIYKVEMSCLELPTAASNVLLDFDLRAAANFTLAEAADASSVGSAVFAAGGNFALQQTIVGLVPVITGTKFLYLTVGNTHTGACTFTAGKLVIRLYGRPSF